MRSVFLALGLLLLPAAFVAGPALAEQVSAESRARLREGLFEELKSARTEAAGRIAEDAIWRMWMAGAPTPEIASQVKSAMEARGSYDFAMARRIFDEVVLAAPDYAEGWNQRAFIRFLQGDLDGSLEDLDRALALEPKHFAALSGKAIIFMQQGRTGLGQEALREAVAIHPWLKERHMLIPEPEKPEEREI